MRQIETTFQTFGASMLLIGLKGESNATEILIDCADALAEYQGTMTAMSITGPDGTVYPGEISLDENGTVHWVVAARDCYIEGNGSARVDLVDDNGTVVASAEATTIILKTNMQNSSGTEPPDQIADWADAASIVLQNVQQALADLISTDDTAQANETARQLAETGRVSAEQLRVSAENLRIQAETGRVNAETARVQAETGRVNAETARVSEFNTIRANAQAALSYLGESEDSSTASAAHTAGTYLIYDGKLYKVTADIAIGDTLAETGDDANIEQVSDGVMAEMISLLENKADKQDTVLDTTLSRGRKGNTTVGNRSIAFGDDAEASGTDSAAFNNNTKASGANSTAHGLKTVASGKSSFATGNETKATGNYSHAEGNGSVATGNDSHAEGTSYPMTVDGQQVTIGSTASGGGSHAEGRATTASGSFSHSEGNFTIANHFAQHAGGEFNIADPSEKSSFARGNYVEIIGNGTDDNHRSNARTLDWEGNEILSGDLTINSGAQGKISVSEIAADVEELKDTKQDAPSTSGTAGQVLSLDKQGNPVWATPTESVSRQEFEDLSDDVDDLGDGLSDLNSAIAEDIYEKTNLYNSTTNNTGGCLRADGTIRANNDYEYTDYIPVNPSKYTYSYFGLYIAHTFAYTCFYDANKDLLSNVSVNLYNKCGLTDEFAISVPETAKYVRFSLYSKTGDYNCIATFKFYQIFDQISVNTQLENLREENPLYEKTAIFFGDSICAGTTDTDGGWAGRIGMANAMIYHNYGYNGATVTAITGHHCIATDVVNAASTYPAPDFVVLEGGTNDADNLDEAGIGTFTENDYSGSYDTTTFSGAFETMLYNAVQQWPHAQIGYISAHKMGNGNNRAMRRTYFLRAQELCKKWGIPFIDLWIESKLNRDLPAQYDSSMTGEQNIASHKLYTDGQHLTPDGYALITPQIEWWMRGI